jgi:quercetin dioxygenase-like cupin family protein
MMSSSTTHTPSITGWTAEHPLKVGFARVDAGSGSWKSGPVPYFEHRNLDLDQATSGSLGCQHVRVSRQPAAEERWQAHDVDFQFLYVLNGNVTLEWEDGSQAKLGLESAVCLPPLQRFAIADISDDFEAVEINAPAIHESFWGRETLLPARAAELDPSRRATVTHETPDQYVIANGPRQFFEYRDLGTRQPTEGRIHLHVVQSLGTPVPEGTGWHYHSMAQWFMVVGGHADIRVEDDPRKHLERIDCFCIGSGPNMRHNVDQVDGEYKVLEMCVPAEYDTIPVDAPEGAAA